MNQSISILGGGQTDFAQVYCREPGPIERAMRDAMLPALAEAQLDDEQLRALAAGGRLGVFVGNFAGHAYLSQGHFAAYVPSINPAFEGAFAARYEAACASGGIALDAAHSKLRAGELDVALVIGVELMRSVGSIESNDILASASSYEDEAKGVEFFFPKLFGQLTDWVLAHSSGLSESRLLDALSTISKHNTDAAKKNPYAQTRSWDFDGDDFLRREADFASRLGGRTRLRDCAQLTDGAAALVLSRSDFAAAHRRERGLVGEPASRIAGISVKVGPIRFQPKLDAASNLAELFPCSRAAVAEACARAHTTPGSYDVVELHDCFSVNELVLLGVLGLAEPGGEVELVESGAAFCGGKCPVNPSGGLIGAGHPVGASGVRMALDLHRQLTGRAHNQVPGARRGAMLNIGGSLTTTVCAILEAEAE